MAGKIHDQAEEEKLQTGPKTRVPDDLLQRLQEDPSEELQDEIPEQLQKGSELRDQIQHPLHKAEADLWQADLRGSERSVRTSSI